MVSSHPGFPNRAVAALAAATRQALCEVMGRVAEREPADAALAALFRRHREWGGRDRRFIGAVVFSFFRWKGWTELILPRMDERAALIAYYLDATESHPVVARMAADAGWTPQGITPMASFPLEEKAKALASAIGGEPPSWQSLVPAWLEKELMYPETGDGKAWFRRMVESFQVRPPTWLRVAPSDEEGLCEVLQTAGVAVERHARLPGAFVVPAGTDLHRVAGRVRYQI